LNRKHDILSAISVTKSWNKAFLWKVWWNISNTWQFIILLEKSCQTRHNLMH